MVPHRLSTILRRICASALPVCSGFQAREKHIAACFESPIVIWTIPLKKLFIFFNVKNIYAALPPHELRTKIPPGVSDLSALYSKKMEEKIYWRTPVFVT